MSQRLLEDVANAHANWLRGNRELSRSQFEEALSKCTDSMQKKNVESRAPWTAFRQNLEDVKLDGKRTSIVPDFESDCSSEDEYLTVLHKPDLQDEEFCLYRGRSNIHGLA